MDLKLKLEQVADLLQKNPNRSRLDHQHNKENLFKYPTASTSRDAAS